MFGYKDIDKIEVGDYVLSYNINGRTNQFKKVTHKFIHEDMEEYLYKVTTDDNKVMELTHQHNAYIIRDGIMIHVAAEDLKIGDKLIYSNDEKHEITNITYKPINETVYNLEIADNHNFYVTENEILVHNARYINSYRDENKHY